MSAESKNLAWEIFSEALDLEEGERPTFLERRCAGNEGLRREVDSLLSYSEEGMGFLAENPRPDVDTVASPTVTVAGPTVPDRIGQYELVRKIGEGGMGIVYEAVQEKPRRRVALKIMRPGYFIPGMQKRFEYEVQVLGRLQHPGIAHVYEAGTVDLGSGPQPFFAMEFIEGTSITHWVETHGLGTRERLELMARACDAAHHAHQKGVLHRDLKPDNILVDKDGQPKILDFGVARPLDQDGGGGDPDTMITKAGQMIGTLAYMSPEQVRGDRDELDTRSDVYALGVICYELLAGKRPHDTSGRSITETIDTICHKDATRLGSLVTTLRGDVEIIVAKALEKDKERRYQSALDLGADIRRFLAHQPILARAPSAIYQIRRFAGRHKGLVAGMVLAVVFLVVGGATSLVLAVQADTLRAAADDRSYRLAVRGAADALDKGRHATAVELLDDVERDRRGWAWHHVHGRTENWTLEIEMPVPARRQVAYTPDGGGILATMADGSLGWWSANSGALVRRLTIPGTKLTAVAANSHEQGRWLAAGAEDGRVFLWDVSAPESPMTLRGHTEAIVHLRWGPGDTLYSADAGVVWQWQGTIGRLLPLGKLRAIRGVCPSPDGRRLAVQWGPAWVNCFDVGTWRQAQHKTLKEITSVIWTKDSRRLICGTKYQNVHILDATVLDRWTPETKILPRLDDDMGHDHWITGMVMLPDGKRIVSSTRDGVITFRDATSTRLLGVHARGKPLGPISLRPDGRQLACMDAGGLAVTVWDLPLGPTAFIKQQERTIENACWSPDSRLVACVTTSQKAMGAATVFDAVTGEPIRTLKLRWLFGFASDSRHLLGQDDESLVALDLVSGKIDRTPAPKDLAKRAEWTRSFGCVDSPHYKGLTRNRVGEYVTVFGPRARVLRSDSSEIAKLDWPGRMVLATAWSHDGRLLAVGGVSKVVQLHDTVTWQKVRETGPNVHTDNVMGLDFSPDGRLLVTGSRDKMIRLFDVETLRLILEMPGHTSHLTAVVFSADGSRILSTSGDGTLRMWDTVPRRVRSAQAQTDAAARAAIQERIEALMAACEGDAERVLARVDKDPALSEAQRQAAVGVLMRGHQGR